MRRMHWTASLSCLLFTGFVVACSDDDAGLTSPQDFGGPSTTRSAPFAPGEGAGLTRAGSLRLATTDCTFTTIGTTMRLDADCTTDATIFVPNGFTLDGRNHTITAVDPPADHFRGAVVQNAGTTAHVKNLGVTASGLANVCDAGNDRLRGIMFEGASGTIEKNHVFDLRQVASGCQEGNSIEVRNAPFDGTHPNTQTVVIANNAIEDFMKTGIVTNGDVDARIEHNGIGPSANQDHLAANSIQVGFGAIGAVQYNDAAGNSWCCADAAATGILVFDADGADVHHNDVDGNADVGIFFELSDGGAIQHNKVYESGPDGFYDIGIGDYGVGNDNRHNDVCGYDTPYDGNTGTLNKVCNKKL
jgi:hypothetical protein